MLREILSYRHKLVREGIPVGVKVDGIHPELRQCLLDMQDTMMHHGPGIVGLASNQIGYEIPVIMVRVGNTLETVINPNFTAFESRKMPVFMGKNEKGEDNFLVEGCFSIKGIFAIVNRWPKVRVSGLVLRVDRLEPFNQVLTGAPAAVAAHEKDHLDGVLITDRVVQDGGRILKQNTSGEFREVSILSIDSKLVRAIIRNE